MTPGLVIFDCDGVLVDSEPITNRELAADLTAHGLPLTTEECIANFVGGTMRSVAEKARTMGADLPDDWVERFYDRMCAALDKDITAIRGAAHAVDRITAAGIPVAIGSNGPMRKMDITLGRTGLVNRFTGRIFSAHEMGIAKPDPTFYTRIADTLDTPHHATIVIEDSASGVKSAVGGGLRCLGYAAETPAETLAVHGAEPFDDMAALPALLGLNEDNP